MTVAILKKKINQAISEIDNADFLNALHAIISSKKEEDTLCQLSSTQKKELEKRMDRHRKGQSKSFSWKEVKNAALKK
jgi:hypothetical protein